LAFAQTQITDRAGLEGISANLAGSYVLTDDIDLSGANWTMLGTFTGTLDGNGHVITGLTMTSGNPAAMFHTLKGTVKNLGFENASVITTGATSRTAVLAGFANSNAVIENCYIANSIVGGRWCVGSFVGRADGVMTIRNCYSSAYVYTYDWNNDGTGHVGGIIGNLFVDGCTVENCYFSGIIQKMPSSNSSTEGQVAGIVGWNGKGGPDQSNVSSTISNNVNLAPYLLSNHGKRRIAGSCRDQSGGEPTSGSNYSLSTTVVSSANDWGNTAAIITTGTATNKDGANIPDGDANAKTQSFYSGLGWDFTDIWTISEGASYPCFSWAKDTTSFVVVPASVLSTLRVEEGAPLDLSKYIFSGRGRALTFTTGDPRVSISGSVITLIPPVLVDEVIGITVKEANYPQTYTLQVTLQATQSKNANLSNITLSEGELIPAFSPDVTSYKVLIPLNVTSITATATKDDALSSVAGDGAKDVTTGATQTITVTAEYGNTKDYVISYVIPEYINDLEGLEGIGDNSNGNYMLTDDIDLSGKNWMPLGDFTGTLDGNGHVIKNMTINLAQNGTAFFQRIKGSAVVKNLGFENASVTNLTESRTAILAGFLEGSAVIENCYIANSTILGRWCVGSFVGRATNITDGGTAAIRNCYSSATIFHSNENNNGRGMTGGIIGNIFDGNKMVVEKCYFAGIIQKVYRATENTITEGNIAGIVGWIGQDGTQTISGYTVQNNVNLAPYILSNYGKHRISSTRGDENVNDPTPGPNYSLSSSVVSIYDDWGNTSAIITTGTSTNKDGENIPDGDENAKAQTFYETTLGWDFTNKWEITTGGSYPKFQWADNTRPHFVTTPISSFPLSGSATIDLGKYIFSGRGLPLTFSSLSDKIQITGSVASIVPSATISTMETVTITVKEGNLTPVRELQINLIPTVVHIAAEADLEQIRTTPNGNFVLDNDITMTSEWTPVNNFTGTLDGNGHVIFGLTPVAQDGTAFFKTISGNAIVKNLGFENVNVNGGNNVRCAVVAGYMEGSTLIENCYIANSTISGRWHVGSFVGRVAGSNSTDRAIIRNCYSSAFIYTPQYSNDVDTENSGHAGGIVGVFNNANNTVQNCYFAGVIQRNPSVYRPDEGQVAGIVAWNNGNNNVIEKNVNLAPYLLSNNGKHRISSVQGNEETNNPSGPNYSLSTTVVSTCDDWENTSAIVTAGTSTNKDGADIPGGDENAKTQTFYETTLGWDFTDNWEITTDGGYPKFQWADDTRPHFVVPNIEISLTNLASVDLSKYIFSGRGLNLTFSTTSDKINIVGSEISFAQPVLAEVTVTVDVKEGSLTQTYPLSIKLIPALPFEIAANSEREASEYNPVSYTDIVFNEGSQLTGIAPEGLNVNGVVKVKKTFAKDGWYAIGFPFDINNVSCDVDIAGDDNYDKNELKTYNPNGGSGNLGDYWLKYYDGSAFVYYADGSTNIAAGGYALQVPDVLDGATFTFTSANGITISNSSNFAISPDAYAHVSNPSVANTSISPLDVIGTYYIFGINPAARADFGRLTVENAALKTALAPFESVIIANGNTPLLSSLNIDNLTALPKIDLSGEKIIAVEYYNLQGQKIEQLQDNSVYIMKSVYESGKTVVSKLKTKN
jgi:hypothetical protein